MKELQKREEVKQAKEKKDMNKLVVEEKKKEQIGKKNEIDKKEAKPKGKKPIKVKQEQVNQKNKTLKEGERQEQKREENSINEQVLKIEKQEEIEKKQSDINQTQAKITTKESLEENIEKKENQEPTIAILEENETSQQESQEEEEKNKQTKKRKMMVRVLAIVSIVLLLAITIFSTIFALLHKASDKIIHGVTIQGIDVSGLTQEEATNQLNEILSEQLKKDIILTYGEFKTLITPEQIEMKFNIIEAVDLAYSLGRKGNIIKDNYTILQGYVTKIAITPNYFYNDELLTNFIESTEGNLPNIVKQSGYSIDGKNLMIDKGEKGTGIQKDILKRQMIEACTDIEQKETSIEIPTIEQLPEKIDLQKIRTEIYKEAKDAYYTQNPFTIYPHVNGVDFGISIEEAQNLLDNTTEQTITIPLNITIPKITTNHIGTEAFPNLLATFSTTFSTSNANRTTNIKLATNKINGVVLMPGETFSYNQVVGQRTAAAGYKTAAVYVGGKVENGIGGGICQVSSTLYNTALRANLEIVKRYNHRFATGYVPLSTDATVSWGGPDFVFKNSRKYPVKVVANVNGGKITVSMYGCKEETEYEVIIQSQTLQTIPMQTVYRTNLALPKGTTKKVQKGHGGYKSRAYRNNCYQPILMHN